MPESAPAWPARRQFLEAGRISSAKRLGRAPVRFRAVAHWLLRPVFGRPHAASIRPRSGSRPSATSADGSGFRQTASRTASFRLPAHRARYRANRFPRRTASACVPVRSGCIRAGINNRAHALLANEPGVGIFLPRPVPASPRQACGASGCRWFRTGPLQTAQRDQTAAGDLRHDRARRTIRRDRPRRLRQRDRDLMCMSVWGQRCRQDRAANVKWNARKSFRKICRTMNRMND